MSNLPEHSAPQHVHAAAGAAASASPTTRSTPTVPHRLGVGHTWFAQLPGLLASAPVPAHLIEIDPKRLWVAHGTQAPVLDETALIALSALPGARVLRGSDLPLAGSLAWCPQQAAAWQQLVQALRPAWVSAPLGFAQAHACAADGGPLQAGAVLPPLHNADSVRLAVQRIAQLRELSGVPVALHVVPNHLRRRPGEMPDGEFYAAVADATRCGLVLDLHTLLRHERYGRSRLRDVMHALPLHQVWQLRVQPAVLPQVTPWLADWLGALPARAAVVLDATPALGPCGATAPVDVAGWAAQVHGLAELWSRPHRPRTVLRATPARSAAHASAAGTAVVDSAAAGQPAPECDTSTWERVLACLANHRLPPWGCAVPQGLIADPGLALHRLQVETERHALLVDHLPATWRLLAQALGPVQAQALLNEFWRLHPAQPLPLDEVRLFANCLHRGLALGHLPLPQLRPVLNAELARWRLAAHVTPASAPPLAGTRPASARRTLVSA